MEKKDLKSTPKAKTGPGSATAKKSNMTTAKSGNSSHSHSSKK